MKRSTEHPLLLKSIIFLLFITIVTTTALATLYLTTNTSVIINWSSQVTFFIAVGALLMTFAVFMKYQDSIKIILSFIIGTGIYLSALNHFLLQQKSAVSDVSSGFLTISESILGNMVLISIIILLILYPVQLLSKKTIVFLISLLLLTLFNEYFGWFALPFQAFYFLLLTAAAILIYRFLMINKWEAKTLFSALSILILIATNYLLIAGLNIHPAFSVAVSVLLIAGIYFMLRAYLLRNIYAQPLMPIAGKKVQIINDIHDTVGASLITLMNQMSSPQDAERVKSVIQTLRDTIRLSSEDSVCLLEDILADNHAEARERIELANCALEWSFHNKQASLYGPKKTEIQLSESITVSNIIREAITNALKHGQPTLIRCGISLINKNLHLLIRNDGKLDNPENWQWGFGLRNMKARIEHLGGTFSVAILPRDGVPESIALMAILPLKITA